ncbi:MAG TPA: hypothetical protein VNO82_05760 [Solirubrobacteraceae bacterium]|nr:hypothetical protein [Solirubrobacteraceae bacterium]
MSTHTNTTGHAAEAAAAQEAAMGKTIPAQHPAVVLRSHYRQLRALLATAMIAVVGLTAAVVILATNDDRDTSASSATQVSALGPTGSTRYDGGPDEGSRGVVPAQPPSSRYDGGPEEGSRGPLPANASPNAVPATRYDGGPEEGSRGSGH